LPRTTAAIFADHAHKEDLYPPRTVVAKITPVAIDSAPWRTGQTPFRQMKTKCLTPTIVAKRNGAMENEKIAFEASFNSFNVVHFGVPVHPLGSFDCNAPLLESHPSARPPQIAVTLRHLTKFRYSFGHQPTSPAVAAEDLQARSAGR
jgi:hypothetical protein